jgi:hypothetical protein
MAKLQTLYISTLNENLSLHPPLEHSSFIYQLASMCQLRNKLRYMDSQCFKLQDNFSTNFVQILWFYDFSGDACFASVKINYILSQRKYFRFNLYLTFWLDL